MGEIKTTVRIDNAIDVGNFRRGMIAREQIRSVTVEAVVDTRAVRSCIPVDLKEKLGLETIRHINAQMANGQTESVVRWVAAVQDGHPDRQRIVVPVEFVPGGSIGPVRQE